MVESNQPGLSLSRQCRLLNVNRSSVYYKPRPISSDDLELMRLIDDEYMKRPTSGSRSIRNYFSRQGRKVNRKRILKWRGIMRQVYKQ